MNKSEINNTNNDIQSILLLRSADVNTTVSALNMLRFEFPSASITLLVQASLLKVFKDFKIPRVEFIEFPFRDFNLAVPEESLSEIPSFDMAFSLYKNDGSGYDEVDAFLLNHIASDCYGAISGNMEITVKHYSESEKNELIKSSLGYLYGHNDSAAARSALFSDKHCPSSSRLVFSGESEILIDTGGKFSMTKESICRFGLVPPDWSGIRDEGKAVARIQSEGTMRLNGSCNFFNGVKINIFPQGKFSIGDGSYIAFNSHLFIEESIEIGANCAISWNVEMIDTDFHRVQSSDTGVGRSGIVIGDSVWIGTGAKILKGVEIGDNVIVGAYSVVTKSFPGNVIIAGNPARQIGEKSTNYRV